MFVEDAWGNFNSDLSSFVGSSLFNFSWTSFCQQSFEMQHTEVSYVKWNLNATFPNA